MNPNRKYRAIRCSEEETQQLLNAWKRAEAVKNCTRHSKTAEHLSENHPPDEIHPTVTKMTLDFLLRGAK